MKKQTFLSFFALCVLLHTQAHAASDADTDARVLAFMQAYEVPGMSVALLSEGKTKFYNYGYANEYTQTTTSNDTIYTIASFTKTFTATLAAVAHVEGKMSLNAPITTYLHDIKNDQFQKVTLAHLLSHTAGLPFDLDPRPTHYSQAVEQLQTFTFRNAPGVEYSYSNIGIGLVGYALEHTYGASYQTLLDEKLLNPLGMRSTYLTLPKDKELQLALGHEADNRSVPYQPSIETWFAAASLKSTISDMAAYLQAQFAYSVLSPTLSKALKEVHASQFCFADKVSCEQLAWQAHLMTELDSATSDPLFVRFGSNDIPEFASMPIVENTAFGQQPVFIDKTCGGFGMSCYMAYSPSEKKGVVILINKATKEEKVRLGRDLFKAL